MSLKNISFLNDTTPMSNLSDKALLKLWFSAQTMVNTFKYLDGCGDSVLDAERRCIDLEVEMNLRGFRA